VKPLVGPRDQLFRFQAGDERFGTPLPRDIYVRPAVRVVYEGSDLDRARDVVVAYLAAHVKRLTHLWRVTLELGAARKAYRAWRRFKLWFPNAAAHGHWAINGVALIGLGWFTFWFVSDPDSVRKLAIGLGILVFLGGVAQVVRLWTRAKWR
jgi:hypothetical protein